MMQTIRKALGRFLGSARPAPRAEPAGSDPVGAGFQRHGPWVTRFTIEGRQFGGSLSFDDDPRIGQFYAAFPGVRSILELGSLEGGQSFQLAKRPGVRITALEGRAANIRRAEYVQGLLGVTNVDFTLANLEEQPLASFGRFDAVFCSGLLYHLPRPWDLLDQFHGVSDRVFIWTHYAAEAKVTDEVDGFRGHWYKESGIDEPLSGLSPRSFWITLDALTGRLRRNGFEHVEIVTDDPHHVHGPCVTLAAWR